MQALLAASVNDEMHVQIDVISAYVQGKLHDEIYMEQREILVQNKHKDKVYKLLKPLYELKQSGREWYNKLDCFLVEHGGKCTSPDPCTYVFEENVKRAILDNI